MDRELRRRVIAFLEQHVGDTAADRKAALSGALHGCSVLHEVGHLDERGSTFASHLTDTLDEYGRCDGDEEPSLLLLIRHIGSHKGDDVQAMANALCDDLMPPERRDAAAASAALASGQIINGRYKLLQPIGDASGQASVWQAQDMHYPQLPLLAIKCMKPHPTRDYASRFLEEVRSLRELGEHPHIIQSHDFGVDRGLRYLVMPLMRESLRTLLDRTGRLSPDVAVTYLRQMADALDFAHQHGIIHRDLKPANMLFTRERDRLCLADFGIAYRLRRDNPVTGTDETAATEEYAAPEQLRSTGSASEKSDIYALAIIAYELLTGELPFRGSKAEIAAQHLRDDLELPENAQLAPFVLQVLRMGAAKNTALRPQSAADFVQRLQDALDGKAPQVIRHYLDEVLPAHLQEVMPPEVFRGLTRAFVNPAAELRQQQTRLTAAAEEPDWDLFPPEVTADAEPDHSLSIELGGELWRPREGHYSAAEEYTANVRERLIQDAALRRVVLLGEPGAGKTFMLGRLALDYAEACRANPASLLPVFVPLSRYDSDEPFRAFVERRVGVLRERLGAPNTLWLLDALNEMPRDKGQWRHLKAFIAELVTSEAAFMLTCRARNYEEDLHDVPGLYRVDLQDLNPQQIHDILTHFLKPTYADPIWETVMHGAGLREAWQAWDGSVREFWERPKSTWEDDDQKRQHLWARARMHNDPRKLMLLCRNPFTLVRLMLKRMGLAVRGCNGELSRLPEQLNLHLPDNRADLFKTVIGEMIQAEAQRQQWTDDDRAAIHAALEFGAAALQANAQRTEMPLDELLNAEDAPGGLIERLRMGRDAGIISLTESALRFNHQLYQEYFATRRLRDLLDDYTRRHPDWQAGEALPPRDERLAELFPRWWAVGGWRVTLALLGELEGRTGIHRVVRWLAGSTPEIAVNMVRDNNDGLTLDDLNEPARQALTAGALARTDESDPRGRAAAYRVLGLLNADPRPGIGVKELQVPLPEGEGFRVRAVPDIDWVPVPAGEFIYGDDNKGGYPEYARPADRQVLTLPAFEISRYPITYAQYQAFIDDPQGFYDARWWEGLALPEGHNSAPGEQWFKYGNHPRENVSWYDAMAFCRWLSWRLGGGYALEEISTWAVRLPTEVEWEQAARGTDGREYPWGDGYREGYANVDETARFGGNKVGEYFLSQTTAVGLYTPGASPYGLQDMSGNVWEWCLTDYDSPALRAEDENMRSNARRVLRGGSWFHADDSARAASRLWLLPYSRYRNLGFRVCRPPSL